jgi:hypothetical protein
VLFDKPVRTAIGDKAAPCPLDQVNRQFCAPAPDRLSLSDFTFVATWSGLVYVAFVIDGLCRPHKLDGVRTAMLACARRPRASPT